MSLNTCEYSYIDIHTHNNNDISGVLSVKSCSPEETNWLPSYYTIGIHPWQVREDNSKQVNMLREHFKKYKAWGVGETGLDRRKNFNYFSQQKTVFAEQLRLASEYCKPVVIHNVKASSDILAILKAENPKVPLIFHGFTGNIQTAEQSLKYNSYFSFGAGLLKSGTKTIDTFLELPIDKIFFETDTSESSIKQVYGIAAKIKKLPLEMLCRQLKQNFKKLSEIK